MTKNRKLPLRIGPPARAVLPPTAVKFTVELTARHRTIAVSTLTQPKNSTIKRVKVTPAPELPMAPSI